MEVSTEDGKTFLKRIQHNAQNQTIWSTVVGVGLDLGAEVIQSVSRTIGCNYCNVRNARTFDELMNTEFHYTVTPIGFNIELLLMGERYTIEQGYGSPEIHQLQDNIKTRQSIKFITEFPSPMNEKNEVRGGCLLFKIIDTKKDENEQEKFKINTSWDTISGIRQINEQEFEFSNEIDSFTNSGIRKAILLVHFTTFMKRYLKLRQASGTPDIIDEYQTMRRQYPRLVEYFKKEMTILDDKSLDEEEYKHLLDIAQQDDIPLDANFLPPPLPPTAAAAATATAIADAPATATKTLPSLEALSRRDLQTLAKQHSIKGNLKTEELVRKLSDIITGDATTAPTTGGDVCCICLTSNSTVILLPCNHKCLCKDCANNQEEQLNNCPLCRQNILHATTPTVKRQRTA